MPRTLTEPERQEFLAAPHVAVISVANVDGRPPLATPVWYGYQPGGDLTFFTGVNARKARLIRAAGVVTVLVQQEELPYKYVTVEASVVRAEEPPSVEDMLGVARRYLPEEAAEQFVAAERDRLVLFIVRPDRWLSADFTEDAG
jgi:PPOX class probable F420-dependent enzyme